LLETIRRQDEKAVYIYTSSSSVYGHSGKAPFAEDQIIDQAASLYALSKQSIISMIFIALDSGSSQCADQWAGLT
jgi:nucleoside-diphosphate-sugar epimerase